MLLDNLDAADHQRLGDFILKFLLIFLRSSSGDTAPSVAN
jgi:hypothetical protein